MGIKKDDVIVMGKNVKRYLGGELFIMNTILNRIDLSCDIARVVLALSGLIEKETISSFI